MKRISNIQPANWARSIRRSALQEMLREASRPGVVSFALGLPAPELFPAAGYADAFKKVLTADANTMQYGPPSAKLKGHIVRLMKQRGIDCVPEQVFLTAGAQQGMSLLTRLLLNQGGSVITEELTYTGFIQALQPFEPRIYTVPTELVRGMDVEALDSLLRHGGPPALIYCMTDGHNPLGVSLSLSKRDRLLEIVRQYQAPIIEDDAYGFLQYDQEMLPPLRAKDDQLVLYIGSFSKIMGPALRVGWILLPESLIPALSVVKEAADIDTTTVSQQAIATFLDAGHLDDHIFKLRSEYVWRRDVMLAQLEKHFPEETRWNRPTSGVFIWVELPESIDTSALLVDAIESGVAFIPGGAFNIGDRARATNSLRLNFSNCSQEKIEKGIERLAVVVKNRLRQT
jgi:2-aminoadipate transaminase